jgi:RHS repeat-associated protein
VYTAFGITPTPTFASNNAFLAVPAFTGIAAETEHYFFHPDHLGSSNYITNFVGEVSQHMEYFAFGETFIEEHKNSHNSPYKFNSKELDEESGLYYYGARYYDSRISIWASVDPLAEKMPSWSPYSFCFNNPMRFVDPDGKVPTPAEAASMAAHVYGDKKNGILIGDWKVSSRDFGLTKKDLNNTATGLKSQIYERTVNGKTEYTYATAGTEASWKDVGADVKQPLGLSKQYAKAADNAEKINNKLLKAGEELTFTGHSLGGGEAALNALLTDRNAITFNAAGVSDITKVVEGNWKTPFKSEGKIEAYIMATDPLNIAQDLSPLLPNVNGDRNYLQPTDKASIYNGHSINNILKSFGINPDKYKK